MTSRRTPAPVVRPARRPAGADQTARRGVERALAQQRRKYEDEHERLVEATFRVMRRLDTADPTVSEILAEAGLSTSAFYRHFPTKDDLLVTLLQRANELTRRHVEDRLAASPDPEDRIARWIGAVFGLLRTEALVAANRPFLIAHPRLLERFPDEIEAGFAALVAPLEQAVGAARLERGQPVGDAAGDARLVLHQVFGMLVDAAALRRRVTPATVAAVVDFTRRAVLAPV